MIPRVRSTLLAIALLTLGATAGSCPGLPGGDAGGNRYDPCASLACGAPCTTCRPGAVDCAETAVVKGCDPFGQCVAATPDLCLPPAAPCAKRACGQECVVEPACRSAVPPCMVPSRQGRCDRDGGCETNLPVGPGFCAPPLPAWGCRGKACGDSCGYCPPGADLETCPVPTLVATACDATLQCVTVGTFGCGP
jgi:hypothetical protein